MPTLEEVRARIRQNFPPERTALRWGKVTDRIIRSTCGRFQIEKRGDGEATRFYAFLRPDTVIGHRLMSAEQAKAVCEQHASPLPLEAPPATDAPVPLVGRVPGSIPPEREPGCDDDLGEEG